MERYPNLKCLARHVRYAHSGSENSLKAYMRYESHTFESKLFTFHILDRVGGGDANITDDTAAIRNLMNMNYDIKR